MMLFIPPLLFADGWRIPKRELFMARRSILMLALGLVFMTVLAIGRFVHALLPSMPLPVAFALAAVLSPTDAVALLGYRRQGQGAGQADAHSRRRSVDERRVRPRRAEVRAPSRRSPACFHCAMRRSGFVIIAAGGAIGRGGELDVQPPAVRALLQSDGAKATRRPAS